MINVARGVVEDTIRKIDEVQRRVEAARVNASRIIQRQKARLDENRRAIDRAFELTS